MKAYFSKIRRAIAEAIFPKEEPVIGMDFDPLDSRIRQRVNPHEKWVDDRLTVDFVKASSFPVVSDHDFGNDVAVGDSMNFDASSLDGSCMPSGRLLEGAYGVPQGIFSWFNSQGFIGYQACAIIAQHWLVDKACSQSVRDAVRNGWKFEPDAGHVIDSATKAKIEDFDSEFKVKDNLIEMGRFANIFGIRIVIFVVDSDDPDYYRKPFNPDGIRPGSYKGMSQIDPYWVTPILTNDSMGNPASKNFYEPDYWMVNGQKYHKSHLAILRGPQPADILKPTYIFGGIPLTQRIYERVYSAERTANEAPLLAMNKRTTAIHVDLDKVAANEDQFKEKIRLWVQYRDNHGVKVMGKEESMEQFDTSLSDFDSVIMNQYQLVAAQASTPATKLLGTSPKGFNATGEFETVSYHEELESIQEGWLTFPLQRHYLCLSRSMGLGYGLNVSWEPVDSMSSEKQAEINAKKVADAVALTQASIVSPDEARDKLQKDRDSGWSVIDSEEDAALGIGETPQNLEALAKAGASLIKAENGEPAAGMDGEDDPFIPASLMNRNEENQNVQGVSVVEKLLGLIEKFIDVSMRKDDGHQYTKGVIQGLSPDVVSDIKRIAGMIDVIPKQEGRLPSRKIGDLVIMIENPAGSVRSGYGEDGSWMATMDRDYGYIAGTVGADGDAVDCFVGDKEDCQNVFVINQKKADGSFDEHKMMIGFDSEEEAVSAYKKSHSGRWDGIINICSVPFDEFCEKIKGHGKDNPLVNPWGDQ